MEIAAGERIRYLFVLCWFYLMPYKSSPDRNVLASKVIDDEGSNIHKTELVVSKIFLDLH